jgi:hypothetical protein
MIRAILLLHLCAFMVCCRVKFSFTCKWAALSIGALFRELEGVHLLGLLREKENAYLDSFFLDPEDINL